MIKKKTLIYYIFFIICGLIITIFYINNKNTTLLTIFKNKVNNIDYVVVETFDSIQTLSKEDVVKLKNIIVEKVNKNKYYTDGNSDALVPVLFRVKVNEEWLLIYCYNNEQILVFDYRWFISKWNEGDKINTPEKEIYIEGCEEIIQLLKKYGIE